jgi:2,3-bisphosphoglycerate-independent phosphoglycerate mutase
MGAGKVIDPELVRINKAIKNNEFFTNHALNQLIAHIKKNNSTLHILGLISQAGVHSHQEHLHALLEAVKKSGLTKVAIHAFTDGRDSPPQENHKYLQELEIATKTGGEPKRPKRRYLKARGKFTKTASLPMCCASYIKKGPAMNIWSP